MFIITHFEGTQMVITRRMEESVVYLYNGILLCSEKKMSNIGICHNEYCNKLQYRTHNIEQKRPDINDYML